MIPLCISAVWSWLEQRHRKQSPAAGGEEDWQRRAKRSMDLCGKRMCRDREANGPASCLFGRRRAGAGAGAGTALSQWGLMAQNCNTCLISFQGL